MVPHQWPGTLDVIWHIYSHLHCSTGDGGRELTSSEKAALIMGQVPCEFWTDCPSFSFLGEAELRACSSEDSARDLQSDGGSWRDLAHLLWAALLQWGFRYGPSVFRGCCSHHGEVPLWVLSRLANLHFPAGSSWHDLAHLLWAVLLHRGWYYPLAIFRGGAPWSGKGPLWVW